MAASPDSPRVECADIALPPPLFEAMKFVFAQNLTGCWLAGGTALAGFYAAHRRSDDLDFFTRSPSEQKAATLAVKELESIGTTVAILNDSNQYFEANCELKGHFFKVTAVLDANLFRVGHALKVGADLQIVDLQTLFKMKSATLVSRCSEKDLYDLIWLFEKFPDRRVSDVVALGNEIDGGVNGEMMVLSVSSATLREDACDFSLDPAKTKKHIYAEIKAFRENVKNELLDFLENEKAELPLGDLVRKIRKIKN